MYREEILEKLEDLNYEILSDENGYMRVLIEYNERPTVSNLDEELS